MTERKPVDGAAPEVQEELDRIWMAVDGLARQMHEQSLGAAREARMPPVVTPLAQDFRMGAPVKPCSCEEALALRAELERERSRRVEHRQMNQSLNEQVQLLQTRLAAAEAKLANPSLKATGGQAGFPALKGSLGPFEDG